MIERIRNVWRPAHFHYAHRLARGGGGGEFEGWYFKVVDAGGRQPYAIIPGVFLGEDAHAFVQVLDGAKGTADYHRFDLREFEAERDRFALRIGRSHFSAQGLTLAIDGGETASGASARGELRFSAWWPWPVRLTSPGVMGPYGFVPFMECNHGILSLDHGVSGRLEVGGVETSYDGGRGYVEKDWGKRFPSAYVWTQSNHFEREGISLTASVARIPWLTGAFRGFLIGLLLDGRLHTFTTWDGGRIEAMSVDERHLELRVRNRDLRLEIRSHRAPGAVLHAPYDRQMIERVAESMTSEIDLRASRTADDGGVFEGRGRHACLEIQGDLQTLLDG